MERIAKMPNFTAKDLGRAVKLYNIAKDMDGLDRVRFNGLDYRYLRTSYARRLPLVAGGLLEEPLLECMKYYHSSEKSMSYDDMGDTGMAMIENYMVDEVEGKNLRPLWAKIQSEE